MAKESHLQKSVTHAAGMRKLSSRTWKNLCATLDRGLLQRMAKEASSDTEDAARMRQGLSNAVLCASAKVQDGLASAGIEAAPRRLMRAAKLDPDVLASLRNLLEGKFDAAAMTHLKGTLDGMEPDPPEEAGNAKAGVVPVSSTFTPIDGADRHAVLRFFSASSGSGLDLSESETLLLYGVLRGVLQYVCVESTDGARRLRASARNGRVSLAWETGRRVAERLRFPSVPERLAKLVAQSLLKREPNPDQLLRLDAAALGLAAPPPP